MIREKRRKERIEKLKSGEDSGVVSDDSGLGFMTFMTSYMIK